jgi:hypothetical protein
LTDENKRSGKRKRGLFSSGHPAGKKFPLPVLREQVFSFDDSLGERDGKANFLCLGGKRGAVKA